MAKRGVVEVRLSDEERRLLLDQVAPFATVGEHVVSLLRRPGPLELALDEEECQLLLDDLASAANHATTRRVGLALAAILDRLDELYALACGFAGREVGLDAEPRLVAVLNAEQWGLLTHSIFPAIGIDGDRWPDRGKVSTVHFSMPASLRAATLEAINSAVAETGDPAERRALDALYGVLEAAGAGEPSSSSEGEWDDDESVDEQVDRFGCVLWELSRADWRDSGGALHLDVEGLTLDDLAGARYFHNCRELMRLLVERDGVKRTASGYLPTAIVAAMMERGRWEDSDVSYLSTHKVVKESDLFDLSLARMLCERIGVVRKYRGKFVVPKIHRPAAGEANASRLYGALFEELIRRCDLSALDGYETQRAGTLEAPFMLLSFATQPAEWALPLQIAKSVMLPIAVAPPSRPCSYDWLGQVVHLRFLRPLEWFGLVESREREGPSVPWDERWEYRKTELFDRFIRVNEEARKTLLGD